MALPDRRHWRRHASAYVFESDWYKVRSDDVELPGGERITYHVVEHPGFAMVVPILADDRVALIRIYRYPVQETLLECPAGSLAGEPPEAAARRELEEETGFTAARMDSLGSFHASTGSSDECFHVFLARDLHDTGKVEHELTEQMETVIMPFAEALDLAITGRISDAPSALALILAARRLGRI